MSWVPNSLPAVLRSTSVSVFANPDKILELEAGTTCAAALRTLQSVGIAGAPVYERSTGEPGEIVTDARPLSALSPSRRYTGFVDVVDVATVILTKGLKRHASHSIIAKLARLFVPDEDHTVRFAQNFSGLNAFHHVPSTATMAQVADQFVSKGARRMAIIGHHPDESVPAHELVGIVTPTDVMGIVQDNIVDLGSLGATPLNELFVMEEDGPWELMWSLSLHDAIMMMLENGITCAPVLGADGMLAGVFSLTDIVQFGTLSEEEVEAVLNNNVLWFVCDKSRGVAVALPPPPITVMPTDTLSSVVTLLYSARVHQLVVIDVLRRPLRLITMLDVLAVVTSPHIVLRGAPSGYADYSVPPRLVDDASPPTTPSPDAPTTTAEPYIPSSGFVTLMHTITAGSCVNDEARATGGSEDLLNTSVPHDATLNHVVKLMRDYSLRSVPVHFTDCDAVSPDDRKYVGWISPLDVIAMRMQGGLHGSHRVRSGAEGGAPAEHVAVTAADFSHTDPFYMVPHDTPMSRVLATIGGRRLDTLGVLSNDSRHHALGVISQQFMLRVISDNRDMLGTLASMPASTLLTQIQASAPFVTVPSTLTATDAVQVMLDKQLTALTVVDFESGSLLGCLSRHLLHALAVIGTDAEFTEAMGLNVVDVLSRLLAVVGSSTGRTSPIVHASDTLGTVLEVMVGTSADAVHVVAPDLIPTGVITPLDIIRAVRPPTGGL